MAGRALHFVFKVGNRSLTAKFYKEVLGMKVLRHEEFTEGCDAACNGPYDNRWSKTMVGYGPEDSHFVVELTYNYGVDQYEKGNDFGGITIRSRESIVRAKALNWPIQQVSNLNVVEAPGGYKFFLVDEPEHSDKDPVEVVTLNCSNVENSVNYWNGILGLKVYERNEKSATVGFGDDQAKLKLQEIEEPIDHAKAYGRIAFSVPKDDLPGIEEKIKESGHKVLTPLISLDTPGKATVTVVILADPDGHEICFVDDENFRKLSEFDPKGDALLERYIKKDDERKAAQ